MELRFIEQGDHSCVSLLGRLDIKGVADVELKFLAVTATMRRPAIVDLSEVTFIGSLGIGMLMGAAKTLKRHGALMVLLDPQDFVRRVLEVAKVPDAIPVVQGIEAARQLVARTRSGSSPEPRD